MKKRLLALGMALLVMAFPLVTKASEADLAQTAAETETTDSDTSLQESIVANENKPYLALGNDLSADQKAYVLGEMGIDESDLVNFTVVYITNDQEHQYLDSYIDPAVIGSYSLSCVMVKANSEGGIRVTTKNINYCTISMYKNALLTAGVENADVLVVGPFPISGTAALIGAWRAYEEMTGKPLEEEAKTAALAEMITMGDLADEIDTEGADGSKAEELIEYIKAEVIAKGLTNADDIRKVIEDAQLKFNVTLTDEQIQKLVDLMTQIGKLDIDPQKLLEQAGDLYNKYGETILADAKAAIDEIFTDEVKQSLWQSIVAFFTTLFEAFKNFLAGNN